MIEKQRLLIYYICTSKYTYFEVHTAFMFKSPPQFLDLPLSSALSNSLSNSSLTFPSCVGAYRTGSGFTRSKKMQVRGRSWSGRQTQEQQQREKKQEGSRAQNKSCSSEGRSKHPRTGTHVRTRADMLRRQADKQKVVATGEQTERRENMVTPGEEKQTRQIWSMFKALFLYPGWCTHSHRKVKKTGARKNWDENKHITSLIASAGRSIHACFPPNCCHNFLDCLFHAESPIGDFPPTCVTYCRLLVLFFDTCSILTFLVHYFVKAPLTPIEAVFFFLSHSYRNTSRVVRRYPTKAY